MKTDKVDARVLAQLLRMDYLPESYVPGKEYSFTIRTGSYPQIIHHHGEYNATGGKIICDEFTDANGKKYTGWIPAIKLWWEEE